MVAPTADRSGANPFVLAGILLIAAIAFVAYYPSLSGGFIWDDRLYLTECELIKAPDGLYRFWFTSDPIDYWPVSNSSLWFEWRLWGMNPAGYRVTNLVLHVCVALLIWAVLNKLAIPGAFLAALLFVVHPVNVESVAWIAQRKGLLAMVFLLLSILWYLRVDAERRTTNEEREKTDSISLYYRLSLAAFLLALLSKGSVALLPIVLLGTVWWLRRKITLADMLELIPFFSVAAVLTVVNIWFQKQHAGAGIRFAGFDERLAGAGATVWFYLSKALLPIDLVFVYPLWKIHTAEALWWLPLCAAVAFTAILWRSRNHRWSRPLLFAWGIFCLGLIPVMGFTDVYFMKFSLVADHYQYHALVAVVALVAAAWSIWHRSSRDLMRAFAMLSAIGIVAALTALTMQQSNIYKDVATVWSTTLRRNPACSVAHNNLGVILGEANQLQESIDHFQQALRLDSSDPEAHHNLGTVYFKLGRVQDAIDQFRQALQLGPDNAETQSNLGLALVNIGHPEQAIAHFQQALKLNPALAETRFSLAVVYLNQGRFQEAIEQYTQGLQTRPDNISANFNLATIYAQLNRPRDAISTAQKALEISKQQGQANITQQIETWLNSYRQSQTQGPKATDPSTSPDPAPSSRP